jgi:serine/threonine protein phosphatase PrpC
VRRHNEDAFLERPDLGLWVVADGMGGMTAGEVASRMIVESLGALVGGLDPAACLAQIRRRLDEVNAALRTMAADHDTARVIGSTVAGLLLQGHAFTCFWAGDSRVYRQRAGRLDRLTRDHSLVQELVDGGLLAPEQAEHHPHASVIRRAVGADDVLVADYVEGQAAPGDIFLLCSDGLTRMLSDEELQERLAAGAIETGSADLLEAVLQRGARDNVTIVLVAVE